MVTIDDAVDAVPVARALAAGGVTAIELTFRTPAAAECIRRIRGELPGITVGAGTLLTAAQVAEAQAAGACFGVAPGYNPKTIRAAAEAGLPFAPGVATASEIEGAVENGCRVLKYFPAETSGGLKHLDCIAGPYAHLGLRYIPLGGLTLGNMESYLRSPHVLCLGGSWLTKPESIRSRNWPGIQRNAAAAAAISCRVRSAPASV